MSRSRSPRASHFDFPKLPFPPLSNVVCVQGFWEDPEREYVVLSATQWHIASAIIAVTVVLGLKIMGRWSLQVSASVFAAFPMLKLKYKSLCMSVLIPANCQADQRHHEEQYLPQGKGSSEKRIGGPKTTIPLSGWMTQESIIKLCTWDSSVDPKLSASWKTACTRNQSQHMQCAMLELRNTDDLGCGPDWYKLEILD